VNNKTLNGGKSLLSQINCLDIVLDTFHLSKIPKKPKSSPNIQKKGLPQGLLLKEILILGQKCCVFNERIVSVSCLQRRPK